MELKLSKKWNKIVVVIKCIEILEWLNVNFWYFVRIDEKIKIEKVLYCFFNWGKLVLLFKNIMV